MPETRIIEGDSLTQLRLLPAGGAHCCTTSPPYWGLRNYCVDGQLGLEQTPGEYVSNLVDVFREVRRVLRDDGTLWLNLGDSYIGGGRAGKNPEYHERHTMFGKVAAHKETFGVPMGVPSGFKAKDLAGIPWRVAFALQADGWYLRSDIVWQKPNPTPSPVRDRPTSSHEFIFLMSKCSKYYYDYLAIREPSVCKHSSGNGYVRPERLTHKNADGTSRGSEKSWDPETNPYRNKRDVWSVPVRAYRGAHFATFPPTLIRPCILAGCPAGGTVLDPFMGAGTVGLVAEQEGRNCIGIELNPAYVKLATERIAADREERGSRS
jgi:DNA modification methylase